MKQQTNHLHDPQTEQAVLACIMLESRAALPIVTDSGLEAADFFTTEHQRIFLAMQSAADGGQELDTVLVRSELASHGWLDERSDACLYACSSTIPNTASVDAYSTRVRNLAAARKLVTACAVTQAEASEPIGDVEGFIERAAERVHNAADRRAQTTSLVTFSDACSEMYAQLTARAEAPHKLLGRASGLYDLDDLMGGFVPGELTVVAARPRMGKTALALSMMRGVALAQHPVLFFSLEMSRAQIITRAHSMEASVDLSKIRRCTLTSDEWARLAAATDRVSRWPINIDDTTGRSVQEVRHITRRWASKHDAPGLVVVDFLQRMRGNHRRTRYEEYDLVSEASGGLADMAKELNVPVVALAQLNREADKRADKRPELSDLRGGGTIEQDAHNVIFIYRDEVYDAESKDKGKAELIVGKQRDGAEGTVNVKFDGPFTRFSNLAHGGSYDA